MLLAPVFRLCSNFVKVRFSQKSFWRRSRRNYLWRLTRISYIMSRLRVAPIALVFAVVAVAGCIGQAGPGQLVSSNDGIQIVDFSGEPSRVDVGDSVIFTLNIQNVGGTDAINVIARLLGVEGQWRELTGQLVDQSAKNIGDLIPPNPLFNQPGDFKSTTWTYRTPALPPGLTVDSVVTAEVLYTYSTTGSMTLRAIGETFLETEYFPKNRIPEGPVIFNTNAPVKILIPDAQLNYYIRVEDDPTDAAVQLKPVQFKLINVGSGFPITGGVPGAIFGTISLRGPGNPIFQDCLGQSGVTDVTIDPGTLGAELSKLRTSNGEVTISCVVALDKNSFVLQDEQIRIDFDLSYRYFIQAPTTLSISSLR